MSQQNENISEVISFDKADLISLVTDIYVAGFCDGRKTSAQPFDTDVVLHSAFQLADQTAEHLINDKKDTGDSRVM